MLECEARLPPGLRINRYKRQKAGIIDGYIFGQFVEPDIAVRRDLASNANKNVFEKVAISVRAEFAASPKGAHVAMRPLKSGNLHLAPCNRVVMIVNGADFGAELNVRHIASSISLATPKP